MTAFDFNAPGAAQPPPAWGAQPPAAAISVVEQQVVNGVTWQRMSDGSVRQAPPEAAAPPAAWGAPPPAYAQPPAVQQQPFQQAAQPPAFGGMPGTMPGGPPPFQAQATPPWGGAAPGGPPQSVAPGQPLPEYVPLDEQVAGMKPPIGTFDVRLATCDGKRSQGPNKDTGQPYHMVMLSLEVVSGRDANGADVAGREIRKTYLLDPRWNQKQNKWNSGGAAEIRDDLLKVGAPPFPAGFRFPINEVEAARIVAMGLGDRIFRIMTYETTKKKGDKMVTNTEVKLVGPAGAAVMPAAAAGGSFGGFAPPA